jgi:hypothetical protein
MEVNQNCYCAALYEIVYCLTYSSCKVPAGGYVSRGEKKWRGGGITKCIFASSVTFVTRAAGASVDRGLMDTWDCWVTLMAG